MLSARASLFLATLALPQLPGLALAQRGVEFGYKDRIFEQTYVLPEGVSGAQLIRQQAQAAMTIGLPGFASDPRLIDAMGGQCVATFMREANAQATMQSVPLTPTQAALERLPAEARVAGPDSAQDTTAQMLAPASPQEACLAQEMLFRGAFEDSLATDRQLANLAQQMRQRFAGVWMTPAQVRDPAFRLGAQRARLMGLRARRLQAIDPTKVSLSAQGMNADLIALMRQMADTPTFEQMAAELTVLEAEMLEEAQARGGKAQGEQRRQAEIYRQDEERRVREEAARAQEEERVRRSLQGQAPSPHDIGTAAPGGSQPPQLQASLQPSPEPDAREMARQRQEADRLARIRQLEGRQAELDRLIAGLEDRLAGQQGAMLRNPLNLQGTLAGVAGLGQTQAEIDRARAERLEVTRALQRLRKAAAASPANTPSAGQPMAAGDGECRPGGTCPVLSLTLFCRTPQQLVAILSQRPGPGRKQVLNVLSASGDCRQVPAGQPLQWTAPMVVVHPQGEPAAELVPGKLQDGMQGFMLRDGVMPRTRDAAR